MPGVVFGRTNTSTWYKVCDKYVKNIFCKAVNTGTKGINQCVGALDFICSTLSKDMSTLASLHFGDQRYWKWVWNIMWERLPRPIDTRQIPFSWLNQSYLPGTYIYFSDYIYSRCNPFITRWADLSTHARAPGEQQTTLLVSTPVAAWSQPSGHCRRGMLLQKRWGVDLVFGKLNEVAGKNETIPATPNS